MRAINKTIMPEQRICQISGMPFIISQEEEKYCKEHNIPLTTISPEERFRVVTSFDNAINLYHGECAFTKQPLLTSVPPEQHHVYSAEIFASDKWDALTFGRPYDFSRTFFDQFAELFKSVPLPSRYVIMSTIENSDYINGVTGAKNCYLIFNCTYCEDTLFSRFLNLCKNTLDSIGSQNSELCYGCINVNQCYQLFWAENCSNCNDSYFLFNCQNLRNCYGCVNLRDKEYYFENQPCDPKEYKAKLQAKNLGSYESWSREYLYFLEREKGTTRKHYQGKNSEDVTGNYINNSKHIRQGFFVIDSEDIFLGIRVVKAKDVFSSAFAANNAQQIYSCHGAVNNVFNLRWCIACPNETRDMEYCIHTGFGSHDCFGCVGLRHKEYCILNKQYSKEEYFDLVSRIRAHMKDTNEYGKLFPASLTPHYYNESYAMEFMPLSKEEAIKRGYMWRDKMIEEAVDKEAASTQMPDHIHQVSDDILKEVFICAQTGEKYRLVKAELDFYRRFQIPLPRVAPLVRIQNLSRYLQILPVVDRECDLCHIQLQSVYKNERVLCEPDYQKSFT